MQWLDSVRVSDNAQGLSNSSSSLRSLRHEIYLMNFESLGSSSKYVHGLGVSQILTCSATRSGDLRGSQSAEGIDRNRTLDFLLWAVLPWWLLVWELLRRD